MNPQLIVKQLDKQKAAVPLWACGALLYQIFPDRFHNGDPSNDVRTGEYLYGLEYDAGPVPVKHVSWDSLPEAVDVCNFHGGDLVGVLQKLPYLKALGVEGIYLNPIFTSPSNHKYDISDYEHVDPHLTTGDMNTTNEWFVSFVEQCHAAGIRVILDGVFNHVSSSHPFFKDAAEHPDSPYRKCFGTVEKGVWTPEYWWDVKTLPKLNYEAAPELEDYIMKIARMWVSPPYNCDGWRLDVAADIGHSAEYNHRFWKRFRKEVKSANPEALIIAEHYGDPSAWLKGDEWDSVMNYRAFMDPVSYYLTGVEKHSDSVLPGHRCSVSEFVRTYGNSTAELTCPGSVFCAMNQLDNHDHSRFLTRTTGKAGRLSVSGSASASDGTNRGLFFAGVILQMTLPGMPCIYYGDETGIPGWTDPDSRRVYPWGKEDPVIADFYSYAAGIHSLPVFRFGSLTILSDEGEVLMYLREYDDEKALCLINPTLGKLTVSIPVSELGGISGMTRVLRTNDRTVSVGRKTHDALSGHMVVELKPYTSKVYLLK